MEESLMTAEIKAMIGQEVDFPGTEVVDRSDIRVKVGSEIPQLTRKVDLLQLIRYSAATWNFFLLHLEK